MKAVILCGGKGTRLRPLTLENPKPLLKVGDKTILEYVIHTLKKNGITQIYMTVGYLGQKIIDYFGDGSKFGVSIKYSIEKERLNTAGSILPIKEELQDDDFVVIMGDQITNVDLKKMISTHKEKQGVATIALKTIGVKMEYGVVNTNDHEIVGFEEKPTIKKKINTAIYILSPKIFDFIGEKEDFAKDVFPKVLNSSEKLISFDLENEWIDIGRLSDYEKNKQLKRRA